jgi:hypothetical protein
MFAARERDTAIDSAERSTTAGTEDKSMKRRAPTPFRHVVAIASLTLASVAAGCHNGEVEHNQPDAENNAAAYADDSDMDNRTQGFANEPSTNAASATQSASEAVDSITEARCSREARCNNVGIDRKYDSPADCKAEVREEWSEDLNAFECAGGIVQKELDECLTEIKNEDCNNPFDTLGRVVACRQGDVCKEMATR